MAECINCGEYTKFNDGLCYKCYKKNSNTENNVITKKESVEKSPKQITKENPWISGVVLHYD